MNQITFLDFNLNPYFLAIGILLLLFVVGVWTMKTFRKGAGIIGLIIGIGMALFALVVFPLSRIFS